MKYAAGPTCSGGSGAPTATKLGRDGFAREVAALHELVARHDGI